MKEIDGVSERGDPRVLSCNTRGESTYLWIHSPGSQSNGWSITVDTESLLNVLLRGRPAVNAEAPANAR
jgi:hypothetical protein